MNFRADIGTASVLFMALLLATLCSCGQNQQSKPAFKHTNSLIDETSPYLLQHAHNPVNWQPWSPEAFGAAKSSKKLVIVSIGYSSCHWCHVMEEESFENEAVADLMNKHFVSIKVDREERPDVDQVYMTAAQLLTGSGGWPLNVITLPDGKPIYAGTYHPKKEWMRVLTELSTLYENTPAKARDYADKVAKGVRAVNLVTAPAKNLTLNNKILTSSVTRWKKHWDLKWGGNEGRFKFMLPANFNFLMDYAILAGDEQTLWFVKTTLDRMAMGGVYDQLGGGFYRYSTDPRWRFPHFEKMLYDNAQMLGLYSRAYSLFRDPVYREVVNQIADFLEREMKHPDGAYYAAMDADSEGEEGQYYTWTKENLEAALEDDFPLFADYYGIEKGQEWEEDRFVLYRPVSDSEFLAAEGLSSEDLDRKKKQWQGLLLAEREKRVTPRMDDKIITSWNALLISGFIEAYKAFGKEEYLVKAKSILMFLETHNRSENKLRHTYKEGSKRIDAFLEDYSFLTRAYLDLYEATGNDTYLLSAEDLLKITEKLFGDQESGFYRFKEDNELISKILQTDDGVIPSANAVMAHNLMQIGHIVYDPDAISKAENMLTTLLPKIQDSPDTYSHWAGLMLNFVYPFYEVAVVGPEADTIQGELFEKFLPNTLILKSLGESDSPLFKNRYIEGETYVYVCKNHSCRLPVTTVAQAVKQLVY